MSVPVRRPRGNVDYEEEYASAENPIFQLLLGNTVDREQAIDALNQVNNSIKAKNQLFVRGQDTGIIEINFFRDIASRLDDFALNLLIG